MIARWQPSRPARWLVASGFIEAPVLDYGAGCGRDALAFGWDAYDPTHREGGPWVRRLRAGSYQSILCTYVLNVIEPDEQRAVLRRLLYLLRQGGRAFISVRRDIPPEGAHGQRWVELALPVLYRRKGRFTIYQLRKL